MAESGYSGNRPLENGAPYKERTTEKAAPYIARTTGKAASNTARTAGKAASNTARTAGKAASNTARTAGKAASHTATSADNAASRGARETSRAARPAAKAGGHRQESLLERIGSAVRSMETMDRIMVVTGVAVLVLAIVTGAVFIRINTTEKQISGFAEVGRDRKSVV